MWCIDIVALKSLTGRCFFGILNLSYYAILIKRSEAEMKHRFLAVILSAIVSVGAFSTPVQQFIGASVTAQAAEALKAPTASKKSGTYYSDGKMKITLSCATEGASIYYSTNNGSTYKLYTKPFYITKNTKIKFYSRKDGVKSKVVTRTYRLQPKFTITPNAGEYDGKQTVKLTSSVPGLKFYYTLDGSKPTTDSALYTAKGITIDESCELRIRTSKSGWSVRYVSKDYIIEEDEKIEVSIAGESILENYTSKYAYSTLTTKQQKLYAALHEGVKAHKATIDVSGIGCSAADLEKTFYAMDYENPQFFWLASGYSYNHYGSEVYAVSPYYGRSVTDAAIIRPQLEAVAKELIDEAAKLDTDFERVKLFHDAIVNKTTYRSSGGEYKRDADGPLVSGYALCEGYSKAFAYLCQSVGIECLCVSGDSDGAHMWNMLKLDGEWYQMDVTFDDPTGIEPTCEYTYFCLSDAQMKDNHTLDNPFTVPVCNSTKYNYYNASGETRYEDHTEAYNALLKLAAENYAKGIMTTEITCTDDCVDSLYNYVKNKGSSVFNDFWAIDCQPGGLYYGYKGAQFYFTLS